MNPSRARCLTDYEQAEKLLRQSYEGILECYYLQAMTPKSSDVMEEEIHTGGSDVREVYF